MRKKIIKSNEYQVRTVLRSLTGIEAPSNISNVEKIFEWYISQNILNIPEDTFFYVPERPLVLQEVLNPKVKGILTNYLDSYPEHTFIVMDAIKSGKDALYICRLEEDIHKREITKKWLSDMTNSIELIANQYKSDIIILASVKSFVLKN